MIDPVQTRDDVPHPRANGKRAAELALVTAEPADPPEPPPLGAVLHPPAAEPQRRRWFVAELWAELRLILRMYFDPRYRVSRAVQFGLPAVGLLFVLNYLFFSLWLPIPVVGPVLERVVCVLLAVVAYKLLARELARYRDVLDYLARYGFR